MTSDAHPRSQRTQSLPSSIDVGLLSPVTVGFDEGVSDEQILRALVTAEVALTRAWAELDGASNHAAERVSAQFGWSDAGTLVDAQRLGDTVQVRDLAEAAVAGGNPVIPLVKLMRNSVEAGDREWVHRGATSQDVLDSALMLIAYRACVSLDETLRHLEERLAEFALAHKDQAAVARTLTQHAVPTTYGLRVALWLQGVKRARAKVGAIAAELPAQLGGAAGTLASFTQFAGSEAAEKLPQLFALELGLAAPETPWHTTRWPVTELGDALTQVIDALGVLAADVATNARTEIAELAVDGAGGSSAMPQKQNPTAAVLVRSASLRAPGLLATLHTACGAAVDERPDGAWHAEWQTLRELLRLALGASGNALKLAEGLHIRVDAVERNLNHTGGLVLAERLGILLEPLIGKEAFERIIETAGSGQATLDELLAEETDLNEHDRAQLLDPQNYLGLASELVQQIAAATVDGES